MSRDVRGLGCAIGARFQHLVGDGQRGQYGDAIVTGHTAATAHIAHLAVKVARRRDQCRSLVTIAGNKEFAIKDADRYGFAGNSVVHA